MTDKLEQALNSPYKKMKDVDREIEFIDADEVIKRKKLLRKNKGKVRAYTIGIHRDRGL